MWMMFLLNSAIAQETAPAAAQGPGAAFSFVPFILIMVIFYFVLYLPQKKNAQKQQQMLAALTKGDEIFTKAGIIGTIIGITDKIVTLEVAEGVRIKILKSEIGGSAKSLWETSDQTKKDAGHPKKLSVPNTGRKKDSSANLHN